MRPSGVDRDAILVARQILGHRQPVDAARHPRLVRPQRNPRHDGLRHHAVRPSLRLDLAERIRRVAARAGRSR